MPLLLAAKRIIGRRSAQRLSCVRGAVSEADGGVAAAVGDTDWLMQRNGMPIHPPATAG